MSSDHPDATGRRIDDVGPVSALIPAVARTHRALAGSLLHTLGLAPGQELLLMELWQQEPRSQTDLAQTLGVEPPTMTKMVGRMERAGLIRRSRDPRDARVLLVSLTDKARDLREPVGDAWAQLERRSLGTMPEADRRELVRLLEEVLRTVQASRGIEIDPGPEAS